MTSSLTSPKVFISYSWKPITNKAKALSLAERMSNEGIYVIIDEWNLSEGQDKYHFMEQMVNDPDIKRVLIISNKDYSEKANQKKGGVGTESLIISDEIYKKANQTKFIPVIFEKDDAGEPYVPTFIRSRIYIDLSSDEIFEEEYDKLMRNILDKPASKRPPLGTIPDRYNDEDIVFLRTAHKINAVKSALVSEKSNYQVFVNEYYSSFLHSLSDFAISQEEIQKNAHIDEAVFNKIDELKVLRDDYIRFVDLIFNYSAQFNVDSFISFLEKLLSFLFSNEGNNFPSNTFGYLKIDQYRFFYYEILLYTAVILIEKEEYSILSIILNSGFVTYDSRLNKTEVYSITSFNHYIESLDKYRNERLNLNRVSVTADLIKQRADHQLYTFDKVREADALLYYISVVGQQEQSDWNRWFPRTTIYTIHNLQIIDKLISLRYFDKIKPLFNVNNVEELKEKVEEVILKNFDNIQRYYIRLPKINQVFDFTKIGIYK